MASFLWILIHVSLDFIFLDGNNAVHWEGRTCAKHMLIFFLIMIVSYGETVHLAFTRSAQVSTARMIWIIPYVKACLGQPRPLSHSMRSSSIWMIQYWGSWIWKDYNIYEGIWVDHKKWNENLMKREFSIYV